MLGWSNAQSAVYEDVHIDIDPGEDEHRKVFLPVTPEQYSHDEDGNLLSDGRWVYEWDGENRLAAMETGLDAAAAGAPQVRLEFVYDYLSRRVAKRVYVPDQGGEEEGVQDGGVAGQTDLSGLDEAEGDGEDPPINWTLEATYKYVWDGWLLVAEVDGQNNAVRSYAWGLDLSGTMQGAGGIGGPLFVTQHAGSNQGTYHAFHDGRGDVTSLRDDAGNVAAAYEYGPFGELLTRQGDYAATNPFRFSSKFTDPETGLVYFGYRYYNPGTGRWLSRDPIEEGDGPHIYAYVQNNPISTIDVLGLASSCAFVCGPDVTTWLQRELRIVEQWGNDAMSTIRRAWPAGVDFPYWVSGRQAAKTAVIEQVAVQLTYFPDTQFFNDTCPRGEECRNTVTLCGMCIHKSEIGNIVYGHMASSLKFSWTETFAGAWYGNRGEWTDEDKAAVRAGYYVTSANICAYFNANSDVSQDIIKGANSKCEPCGSSVANDAPHIQLPEVNRKHVWSPRPGIPLERLPPVILPSEIN